MDMDEEMINQFLEYLDTASIEMQETVNKIMAHSPANSQDIDSFYGVIHNLKGMGQTFGYDLLTDVSAIFCSYFKNLPSSDQVNTKLIEDYYKVFAMIIEHRIDGTGGEKGQAILDRMKEKTDQIQQVN